MTEVIRLPQPDELSEREKDDAMGAYLIMFAAWGVGLPLPVLNLIAAVIYPPPEALGHLLEVAEWDVDEVAILIKAAH